MALFAFVEAEPAPGTLMRVVPSAVEEEVSPGLVLVYEFFWWVIGAIVLALALYILYDNLPRTHTPGRRIFPRFFRQFYASIRVRLKNISHSSTISSGLASQRQSITVSTSVSTTPGVVRSQLIT